MSKYYALTATRLAALAAFHLIGKEDRFTADLVSVQAMEEFFLQTQFPALVTIGEGERDKAPMLFTGQKFADEHQFDIAVDPLEGTNLCALNKDGAISVISIGEKGTFFPCPDIYMHKLAINLPYFPKNLNIDSTLKDVIREVARLKNINTEQIRIIILARDRHKKYIQIAEELGCKLKLIEDGDVMAALCCSSFLNEADIYFGIGGAPEGVIVAAAIAALGGSFIGKLVTSDSQQEKRLNSFQFDHNYLFDSDTYRHKKIVTALTAITDNSILKGVKNNITHSLVIENNIGPNYYTI